MNVCPSCGENFTSVELFDRHRVGRHDYPYKEGERWQDGRRCLSPAEMVEGGWRRDEQGRWLDPGRASRAARAFRPPPEGHPGRAAA